MPANIVDSFAKQSGKSKGEVDKLFKKAEKIAQDMGKKGDYEYIVGILKNMLGLDESVNNKKLERYKPMFEMVSSDVSVVPENADKIINHDPAKKVKDKLESINDNNRLEIDIKK